MRHSSRLSTCAAAALLCGLCFAACGPLPPPANPYTSAPDLLADMSALRESSRSFRIAGTVDHIGRQRVQGRAFLFGELPDRLRVDILSPFGSTLSVLTAKDGVFGLADHREGRYLQGPAQPCNIARLIGIAFPAPDVIRILLGHAPIIEGPAEVRWHGDGFYRVVLRSGTTVQTLDIGPERKVLPLQRAALEENGDKVYEILYSQWRPVNNGMVPFEIRVRMPREKSELILRYDSDGVELDVSLPADAWQQTFPPGVAVQNVACD